MRPCALLLAGGVLLTAPPKASAQIRSLREALLLADRSAYANRIAAGQAQAQTGEALRAWSGVLPRVRFEGSVVRSSDPLAAFGTLLRQRGVTATAFDPTTLNRPDPITNVGIGVVLEQPLVNADAWMARRAAAYGADGRRAEAAWTRAVTHLQVVDAWFGAILTEAQVATLDTALRAANMHVRQTESLAEQGVVTRSDVLLARVRAGEVETQWIAAQGERDVARRRLVLLLGEPDEDLLLPGTLPPADRVRMAASSTETAPSPRSDVRAAHLNADAARLDRRRASFSFLPRLNGFARWDWNDGSTVFGGERSWTVGVVASWSVFGGGSQLGDRRGASGREAAAQAMVEAAEARAGLEGDEARTARAVALAALRIAEQAADQGAEAHRIVSRKYDGGLASVTDLLDAQAVETRARLARDHALFRVIVATAQLRLALGRDLSPLADLEALP